MKIELKKLVLTNFKGIRSLTISLWFLTNVFGENGTGKTTVMDAWLWLLFGKNSQDLKDFEIKTLDSNNNPFHKLDHEVEAHLIIDGEAVVIRRTLRENWVKKRGESEAVFAGHTTSFFWNDVPLKENEYQAKIAEILPENLFKLLTNTSHFNSLKWQDRRAVLLKLAGEISNDSVIEKLITVSNKAGFTALINALNAKKTPEEFKKEVSAKKKTIKEELQLIPSRIDEANRSLPDPEDYTELQGLLVTAEGKLQNIEDTLQDQSKALQSKQSEINAKVQQIQKLRNERSEIEYNIRNEVKDQSRTREQKILDLKRDLKTGNDELTRLRAEYAREEKRKTEVISEQDGLREKYSKVNAEELKFDEAEFACPTCKRAYEASGIDQKKEELLKNFNAAKSKRLSEIQQRGKQLGIEVEALNTKLGNLKATSEASKSNLQSLESNIAELEQEHQRLYVNEVAEVAKAIEESTEIIAIDNAINDLQEIVNTPITAEDNSFLLSQKREIVLVIDSLKTRLNTKDQRDRILKRITELEAQERTMATDLANLEGQEYSIEQFMKAKMDELERRINGRFSLVRFKLFEDQINGGQVECCETLINGIPYSDANTASKINAGLDIINTLSLHFDVSAPVFVDNAESVNTLIPVQSQLIRLVVSKDKRLQIQSAEPALAEAV